MREINYKLNNYLEHPDVGEIKGLKRMLKVSLVNLSDELDVNDIQYEYDHGEASMNILINDDVDIIENLNEIIEQTYKSKIEANSRLKKYFPTGEVTYMGYIEEKNGFKSDADYKAMEIFNQNNDDIRASKLLEWAKGVEEARKNDVLIENSFYGSGFTEKYNKADFVNKNDDLSYSAKSAIYFCSKRNYFISEMKELGFINDFNLGDDKMLGDNSTAASHEADGTPNVNQLTETLERARAAHRAGPKAFDNMLHMSDIDHDNCIQEEDELELEP